MSDYKKDLATIYDDLLSHDIDEGDELLTAYSTENKLSELTSKFKGLLASATVDFYGSHPVSDTSGVRLPKLIMNFPTFDGNIIHWT